MTRQQPIGCAQVETKRLYSDVLKGIFRPVAPSHDKCPHSSDSKAPATVVDAPVVPCPQQALVAPTPSPSPPSSSTTTSQPTWRVLRSVGKGAFGKVELVQSLQNAKPVARKRISHWNHDLITAQQTFTEFQVSAHIQHPNVLPLLRLELTRTAVDMFFPYIDTDMNCLFKTTQSLTMMHVQMFMAQLLLGLDYMHSAGIVHRDIKPQNLLITEKCDLHIADFGLARYIKTKSAGTVRPCEQLMPVSPCSSNGAITARVCTRWYRAPEIILRRGYNTKVDLFAAGCVMGELLQMVDECGVGSQRRRARVIPLFPGRTCFPLSWEPSTRRSQSDITRCCSSSDDQLNIIFKRTGTPSTTQIDSVEVENARTYLHNLPVTVGSAYRDLFDLISFPDAKQVFDGLLEFDPSQRLSAADALKLPFFDDVRDVITQTHTSFPNHRPCTGNCRRCFACLDSRSLTATECKNMMQTVHAEFATMPHP